MIVIAVAMLVIEVNLPLLNIFAPVKAIDEAVSARFR